MTIDDVKIAIIESNLVPNQKYALFKMLEYFNQELDRLEREIKDIQGE